jgi:hypothetical protein
MATSAMSAVPSMVSTSLYARLPKTLSWISFPVTIRIGQIGLRDKVPLFVEQTDKVGRGSQSRLKANFDSTRWHYKLRNKTIDSNDCCD